MMRASGISYDSRLLGYAAYGQLDFSPVVRTEGDGYARCVVRAEEILQSIDLIRQCFTRMPQGAIDIKVTGTPNGEFLPGLNNRAVRSSIIPVTMAANSSTGCGSVHQPLPIWRHS